MLRYVDVTIVFQEIPDEVTLAVSISGCPNHCKGCHSPYLWEDIGDTLTEKVVTDWIATYGNAITCLCFMGGDQNPKAVVRLARYVRAISQNTIKVAWYSGKSVLATGINMHTFDYLKLGPYVESCGGLTSPNTNQRLYKNDGNQLVDMTAVFWKSHGKEVAVK